MEHANFADFMGQWISGNKHHKVIVPVDVKCDIDTSNLVPFAVNPNQVIEARPYRSHLMAILTAFVNQRVVKQAILNSTSSNGNRPVLAIAGPNMVLTLLSMTLPKTQRYLIFIRGNSLKTVSHMYAGRLIKPVVILLSKYFRRRVWNLQRRGNPVLTFGRELQQEFAKHGEAHAIAPLIQEDIIKLANRDDATGRNPPKLLFIGRLSNEKGILELIEGINLLEGTDPGFTFTIAGYGPLQDQILDMIQRSKFRKCFNFAGRVTPGRDVIKMLDDHDHLILPSKTEGVPRVIAEALARKVGVLSTDVGGIRAAYGDRITYIESSHAESIKKALVNLLQRPDPHIQEPERITETLRPLTFEYNIDFLNKQFNL